MDRSAAFFALQSGFGRGRCLPCFIVRPNFTGSRLLFLESFYSPYCAEFSINPHPFGAAQSAPCPFQSEKNKKWLCILFSSFSAPYRLIAITYMCMIFFFIGSRSDAERVTPAFRLLIYICPKISAIAKNKKAGDHSCFSDAIRYQHSVHKLFQEHS